MAVKFPHGLVVCVALSFLLDSSLCLDPTWLVNQRGRFGFVMGASTDILDVASSFGLVCRRHFRSLYRLRGKSYLSTRRFSLHRGHVTRTDGAPGYRGIDGQRSIIAMVKPN